MVNVESLKCIRIKAFAHDTDLATGKNIKAKRKPSGSLAEAPIGHHGELLRGEPLN